MIYLVYKSWPNTSSNHAGMEYLCSELERMYPKKYKAHKFIKYYNLTGTSLLHRVIKYIDRQLHLSDSLNSRIFLKNIPLQNKDKIVFMEAFDPSVGQDKIIKQLYAQSSDIEIYAFSHLIPRKISHYYSNKQINDISKGVKKIFTLGSSLTSFYQQTINEPKKVRTLFHYVDSFYSYNEREINKHSLKILIQGNQVRDINILSEIIKRCPQYNFTVCQGMADLSKILDFDNVILYGFIPEDELKRLMTEHDISLNAMEDTIGSNVIVTSMYMSMAMICSNVGSIKDYCNYKNCFLCNNIEDFVKAIHKLDENRNLLYQYQCDSYTRAKEFSITFFEELFAKELND